MALTKATNIGGRAGLEGDGKGEVENESEAHQGHPGIISKK